MAEPNRPPKGDDQRNPQDPPPPMRFGRNMFGWLFLIGLVLLGLLLVTQNMSNREEIKVNEFWNRVEQGHVESVTLYPTKIEGQLRSDIEGLSPDANPRFYVKYDTRFTKGQEWFVNRLAAGNVAVAEEPGGEWWVEVLPNLLLFALLIGVIWFFFIRQFRGSGGGAGILGNFGRSRHRVMSKEHTNVTFGDVAGIEEAKEEVQEIIEFLKNAKRFQRLGARIPRGVLLVGEPGCGKTLLAKAIAGEADVPFFSISGSDFVEMFVGVGASRVRDLFKQAKDSSPCIIFLDEIDAVGRRRGAGFNGGGHDEREQTLNAILVEMDGFDSSDQVIVIAATNRVDVLDPALTRPGRFDRQINVPLPDIKGRMEILKIYINKVRCSDNVDLQRLARGTPMFSGADLAALVNEAAIAATLANKDSVDMAELEEARDKVRWGRARKSRVVDEREKTISAYHEAGHALVQKLAPEADPLHKVSIIPRGPMGGATFSLPERDRYLYTRGYCQAMLAVLHGGRLAEELFCGDISSGAAGDIKQATALARKMVLDWGMSDKLGFVNYSGEERSGLADLVGREHSDATAEHIDQEVRRIVDGANQQARSLIEDNREKLEAIAQALLKFETIDADEVQALIEGKPLKRTSVTDLLESELGPGKGDAKTKAEDETDEGPAMGPLPQPG